MRAPLHPDEQARLDALRLYFDDAIVQDSELQELARYASEVCGTPVSLVSVVEETRQRFLADVGFGQPETSRDVSFCAHTILQDGVFEIPDAQEDPRFEDNDLVTGGPGIRFYAGVPVLTAEGLPIGALCLIDTVPRRLDPFQRRTLELLGRQVQSRIDLIRRLRELDAAKIAAEGASRSKSVFLANMSHELRTPLNAIMGYAELLQEDATEQGVPDLVPDLQRIHRSGEHLLALINDILDLSKIEAGKMALNIEPFSIGDLVDDVDVTLRPIVEKNGNALRLARGPDLGTMSGDSLRVRQCLFNLLSNAAKFTRNGEIVLDVRRESSAALPDQMVFRVEDAGIGMSPEQISGLFQAFIQADASTTRKYGGTGLGLALTRRYAQMMGGDVTVRSALGEGSVFTMRIRADLVEPTVPGDVMTLATEPA